jgi:hypothetical protein
MEGWKGKAGIAVAIGAVTKRWKARVRLEMEQSTGKWKYKMKDWELGWEMRQSMKTGRAKEDDSRLGGGQHCNSAHD